MKVVYALWVRNLKAFARDKTRLILSIVLPFFFVFIFSSVFRNEYIENPITYMLTGVVVANVFDLSLRISTSTIDDMTSGFMKEVLVSPIPRVAVAVGQLISSATIATIQGCIIYLFGFFIGLSVTSPITIVLSILTMVFIGVCFSGFGLFVATRTKSTQTFQIVTMALTTPMIFISGAYIPLSLLPKILIGISYINPMTYAVALFRSIALEKYNLPHSDLIKEELAIQIGNFVIEPWTSMLILVAFAILFLVLSTFSFVNTDFSRINRNKSDSIDY